MSDPDIERWAEERAHEMERITRPWREKCDALREALLAAREVLDYIDGHGCDDDSREAEKGWKAIDAALHIDG